MTATIPFLAGLADALVRTSLLGSVFAVIVWGVCRVGTRLPAGVRAALWWLVCARLLLGLVWVNPIPVPLLPASWVAPGAPEAATSGLGATPRRTDFVPDIRSWHVGGQRQRTWDPALAGFDRDPEPAFPWRAIAAACWLILVALGALRTLWALRWEQVLVREAAALDLRDAAAVRAVVDELGMAPPEIRVSRAVSSPRLSWVGRPVVLLPEPLWRRGGGDLTMAVCHELLHLRRYDLWLGAVVHVARRLFFFHPLAHLAAREYLVHREAACDAEVLRVAGVAPREYGRLLVRLGVTRGRGALAIANASPSFCSLKRRLDMLQRLPSSARTWSRAIVLCALVGVVPLQFVVRAPKASASAGPGVSVTNVADTSVTQTHPPAPPAPSPPTPATRGTPPAPPAPPAPPVPPAPPAPDADGYGYAWHDDGESWIYLSGPATFSGGSGNWRRAESLRRNGEPLFWFERDGKAYVIRDPTTLKRIGEIIGSQGEAGRLQSELGARQSELGARQGQLGGKQGALGTQQAALAAKQAVLEAERAKRLSERAAAEALEAGHAAQQAATEAERAKGERDVESKREQLDAQMETLGREMDALGVQMEELGRQQEALGRQQERLAEQQAKTAKKLQHELQAVLEEALATGKATEVK